MRNASINSSGANTLPPPPHPPKGNRIPGVEHCQFYRGPKGRALAYMTHMFSNDR